MIPDKSWKTLSMRNSLAQSSRSAQPQKVKGQIKLSSVLGKLLLQVSRFMKMSLTIPEVLHETSEMGNLIKL